MNSKLFGRCWACGEDLELIQNIGVQRPAKIKWIPKHKLITSAIEDVGDSLGLGSAILHCPKCQSQRVYNQIFCPECARKGIQTPCKLTQHNSKVDGKTYINIQCENYASSTDEEHNDISTVRPCKFAINVFKGDGRTIADEWVVIGGMYGITADWVGSLKRLVWYYNTVVHNTKIAEYYKRMLNS